MSEIHGGAPTVKLANSDRVSRAQVSPSETNKRSREVWEAAGTESEKNLTMRKAETFSFLENYTLKRDSLPEPKLLPENYMIPPSVFSLGKFKK